MASNTPFKPKQDKEYNIDKDTVNAIIKKRFNTKKKPKKFTWKGLYDFTSILETNPFSPRKLQRIKELSEGSDANEKDYIDTFEDLEKGFYSGAQKLGYAIGDLVTSGIDLTIGRIGYQQGNMVQPNAMPAAMPMDQGPAQDSPVQDLSFEELRSRLPESITNDVVQLIANSQQALVEFANIQTQQDVKEFNRKYEVNLVLPQEA